LYDFYTALHKINFELICLHLESLFAVILTVSGGKEAGVKLIT